MVAADHLAARSEREFTRKFIIRLINTPALPL
jgi:hypothetical protein